MKRRSFQGIAAAVFASTLLCASSARADVTITGIKVTENGGAVPGAEWCDTMTACLGEQIWVLNPANPGTPLTLLSGQTLVLTQNQANHQDNPSGASSEAYNFDTSDRGEDVELSCSADGNRPCTLTITIFTTDGPITYTDSVGNPITAFNAEPDGPVTLTHQEASNWMQVPVVGGVGKFTLALGYADNVHTDPCRLGNGPCLPQNPWTDATYFFGHGGPRQASTWNPLCVDGNCFDSGAILITATPSGANCVIPASETIISNTSWNKFNVPPGTAPIVWINAHLNSNPLPANVPVDFTNVVFSLNGINYQLPNGEVIFNPSASGSTTTFSANGWQTIVNKSSDEIFFTGQAIPVSSNISGGGKATLSFTTQTNDLGLSFNWQWSAAVYTVWPGNNQANILAVHSSLHAGTPQNTQVQKSLIQGPRGGGGSNFTGSWSATGNGSCQ